jgi:hypothetical protein
MISKQFLVTFYAFTEPFTVVSGHFGIDLITICVKRKFQQPIRDQPQISCWNKSKRYRTSLFRDVKKDSCTHTQVIIPCSSLLKCGAPLKKSNNSWGARTSSDFIVRHRAQTQKKNTLRAITKLRRNADNLFSSVA